MITVGPVWQGLEEKDVWHVVLCPLPLPWLKVQPLAPQNGTLLGNKVSTEVKEPKCGHPGTLQSNTTGVLTKRANLDPEMFTEGKWCQETQGGHSHLQAEKRSPEQPLPAVLRWNQLRHTVTLDFYYRGLERRHFCCLWTSAVLCYGSSPKLIEEDSRTEPAT